MYGNYSCTVILYGCSEGNLIKVQHVNVISVTYDGGHFPTVEGVTETDEERLQKAALEYFGSKINLDDWELDDMYED